jgi:hypothetical protein
MNCHTSPSSVMNFEEKKINPNPVKSVSNLNNNSVNNCPFNFDIHARSFDYNSINQNNLLHQRFYFNSINTEPYYHAVQCTNHNYSPQLIFNPFNQTQISNFDNQNRQYCDEKFIILEKLFFYIRDQNGCRTIQRKFEEKNKDFIDKFYDKVII